MNETVREDVAEIVAHTDTDLASSLHSAPDPGWQILSPFLAGIGCDTRFKHLAAANIA
jgi:hypothetical protein